jgi:uncharacterized protein YukE
MKYTHILSAVAGGTLAVAGIVGADLGLSGCASTPPVPGAQIQASAADLREALKDFVKDAGRLAQMLAVVDQVAPELQAGAKELDRLQQEQSRLNADYTTTPEALRQIGEQLQSVRAACRTKALATRQALAQLATDAEWKKITSGQRIPFSG